MKVVLVLILILVAFFMWFFSTSTKVSGNGKDHPKASKVVFIVKSISYWIAVTLSFCVGMYVNS